MRIRQVEPKGDLLTYFEISSDGDEDTPKAYVLGQTELSATLAVEIDE